jgi:hypothetical protein
LDKAFIFIQSWSGRGRDRGEDDDDEGNNIYNLNEGVRGYGYGVYRHFHEYFSYIVAVSFICGVPGEDHKPASSII